jgi:hypothetical protein
MISFESQVVPVGTATDRTASAKKRGWLPLLVVLFLISYGLMTMLIVEQGQTIESQRTLMREMFADSKELSALKTQQGVRSSSAATQAPASAMPSAKIPATVPPAQAPNSKAPSSQAGQQHAPNTAATQKPQLRMPSKPASDLVDDVRTLITI